jgi:hypothetical protein
MIFGANFMTNPSTLYQLSSNLALVGSLLFSGSTIAVLYSIVTRQSKKMRRDSEIMKAASTAATARFEIHERQLEKREGSSEWGVFPTSSKPNGGTTGTKLPQ